MYSGGCPYSVACKLLWQWKALVRWIFLPDLLSGALTKSYKRFAVHRDINVFLLCCTTLQLLSWINGLSVLKVHIGSYFLKSEYRTCSKKARNKMNIYNPIYFFPPHRDNNIFLLKQIMRSMTFHSERCCSITLNVPLFLSCKNRSKTMCTPRTLLSDYHRSYSTQTGVPSNTRTTPCYRV